MVWTCVSWRGWGGHKESKQCQWLSNGCLNLLFSMIKYLDTIKHKIGQDLTIDFI